MSGRFAGPLSWQQLGNYFVWSVPRNSRDFILRFFSACHASFFLSVRVEMELLEHVSRETRVKQIF